MPAQPDPNYDIRTPFLAWVPGVVWTRDIEAGLAAQYAANGFTPLTQAQVLAVVLPLIPEGNPPQYTPGAPPANPAIMPGASPVLGPALPPQPVVLLPIDGRSDMGNVATFAQGLKRFKDSNPDPMDGWAIDDAAGYGAGAGA